MALTLTPKQKEILDFIRAYRQKRGLSPTQREICEEFGYSSFGTLQKHIKLLLEKGVLVRDWNKRRSLVLAEENKPAGAVELPLAGRIAAGQPIEPEPEGETVAVPDVLTRKGQNYVLRVNGGATLKRFYREADGRIRLQPANERMSPIWVAEGDFKVQGVVVGLMRKY